MPYILATFVVILTFCLKVGIVTLYWQWFFLPSWPNLSALHGLAAVALIMYTADHFEPEPPTSEERSEILVMTGFRKVFWAAFRQLGGIVLSSLTLFTAGWLVQWLM